MIEWGFRPSTGPPASLSRCHRAYFFSSCTHPGAQKNRTQHKHEDFSSENFLPYHQDILYFSYGESYNSQCILFVSDLFHKELHVESLSIQLTSEISASLSHTRVGEVPG